MKISALVTCVGSHFAETLSKAMPIWLDTLDSLTVIMDYGTEIYYPIEKWGQALLSGFKGIYRTDIFTAHGAHFNKGAALSQGFASLDNPEWILNIDADILPEPNWRKKIELQLEPGYLYGAKRYDAGGEFDNHSVWPDLWGFFHLWHVSDPHTWKRPVYQVDVGHAGNYDHTFLKYWPENKRRELPIKLIHQGEPRNNWFGSGPKAEKLMSNLHLLGLYEAWLTKAGHIKVPKPNDICIDSRCDDAWILNELNVYTSTDPFLYRVRVGDKPKIGEQFVTRSDVTERREEHESVQPNPRRESY